MAPQTPRCPQRLLRGALDERKRSSLPHARGRRCGSDDASRPNAGLPRSRQRGEKHPEIVDPLRTPLIVRSGSALTEERHRLRSLSSRTRRGTPHILCPCPPVDPNPHVANCYTMLAPHSALHIRAQFTSCAAPRPPHAGAQGVIDDAGVQDFVEADLLPTLAKSWQSRRTTDCARRQYRQTPQEFEG